MATSEIKPWKLEKSKPQPDPVGVYVENANRELMAKIEEAGKFLIGCGVPAESIQVIVEDGFVPYPDPDPILKAEIDTPCEIQKGRDRYPGLDWNISVWGLVRPVRYEIIGFQPGFGLTKSWESCPDDPFRLDLTHRTVDIGFLAIALGIARRAGMDFPEGDEGFLCDWLKDRGEDEIAAGMMREVLASKVAPMALL